MPSNFRVIPESVKETILKQVKNDGRPVAEAAKEFGVSPVTVYKWLSKEVWNSGKTDMAYLKEIHKLQREKEDLLRIVWAFSVVVERLKKKVPKTVVARDVASEDPACNFGLLARLFRIARSSLWHRSKLDERDVGRKSELEAVHAEHPWYGYRRIGWTLGWGFPKTRRLMKKFGVAAVVKKAKRWTKSDDLGQPDAGIPNLAKEVPADRPDRVWRTDFTFLVWRGIPFYLATVLDAYSREIAGYSIGLRHDAEFVLEAVRDAVRKTGKKPEILHSDQGSEYRSFVALGFLAENGILPSMSAKASPWQNGQQESYYGKFKLETRNLSDFGTSEEAIEAVHHRVSYYNRKRMHTALKMPPRMFRERYFLMEKEKLRTDAGASGG